MRIAQDLLTVADFDDALTDEWSATRPLMPREDPMRGLWLHDGAGEWAQRRCTVEFAPVPGRVVSVRKQRHGVRPVAELSARDRVLYRALVNSWKDELAAPDHSREAYDAFRRAPLKSQRTPKYVVSSDVTACYQYIDHGLLARELLARTGDSRGVDALAELLSGLVGRSFGLPQQSGPSDALAEAYLSVVERRLVRQGLKIWRYSDDFRIAAESWSDALNAVDSLERECRSVGLALNDSKTVIRLYATYEAALDRRGRVMNEISDKVEMDLADWSLSPYDGNMTAVQPEQDDVTVAAASKVLDGWYDLASRANRLRKDQQEKMGVFTDLLRSALPVLRTQPTDQKTLRRCSLILRTEQTLTPHVSRYLAGATDEPKKTVAWFDKFLSKNPYLTPWQVWWVAPSLRGVAGSYRANSNQRTWLEGVWRDPNSPEPVIAGLAFTMADKSLVSADDLIGMFDGMTDIGRPYVARALGAFAPPGHAGAATLLAEDEWVQWAFEVGSLGV